MKCLAKEHGLSLIEYENDINTNDMNFEDGQYVSVVSEFVDQVRCCVKSASLSFGDTPNVSSSNSILLLEDLPNITNLGVREKVHGVLEEYISAREASSHIVIILSDTTFSSLQYNNDSPITKRSFIPASVFKSSRFSEISFNPIAKSFVAKALNQICQKEAFKSYEDIIQDIAVNCEGDIRKAINYLQFYGLRKLSHTKSELIRDEMSMYNILGKIIYNKREETVEECELLLDDSNLQRKLLSFEPEVTIERGQLSYSTLALFLHQNYTTQANTLDEVIHASEYLSLSEICAGYWDSENTMEKYAISIASRGVLYSWDPLLPRKASGYKGFVKPEYWSYKKEAFEFKKTWNDVFSELT